MLVLAIGAGVLAAHALLVYPTFFFDDSFISLRYADRLRDGQGLTWTGGERVEGYTNLLWVLVVGAVGLVSPGLIWVARVFGLISTTLAIGAVVWAYRPARTVQFVTPLWGALALALSGPIAAWSIGGLEHPLLIAELAWAIALLLPAVDTAELPWRRAWAPGLFLALSCWTRPDAPLFVATLASGFVLASGLRWRVLFGALRLVTLPVLAVLAQTLFRRVYYGAWLPNTSSKLGTSWERARHGLDYVVAHWELRFGLLFAALTAIVAAGFVPAVRRRVLLVVLPLAAWLAYVIALGGDFMPQQRHLVPAILLFVFLGCEALRWMTARRFGGVATACFIAPITALQLGIGQQRGPAVADANNSEWYWDARPIGLFFRDAFAERDPLLAVDAAGALPYFSELRSLDMLGLNDRYLAQHPPRDRSKGAVAHDLGDGRYVLSRKPDLVVFHLPYGQEKPLWKSGREMLADPQFRRSYQLVHYRTRRFKSVRGMVWVRRSDGPLSIERTPDRVSIPGWLLSDDAQSLVELDEAGRVGVRIYEGEPAGHANLPLEPGRWRLRVDATSDLDVEVGIRRGWLGRGRNQVVFDLPRGLSESVDVRLSLVSGQAAHAHGVVFERMK